MKKANIMIAKNEDSFTIKVEGRATFECSPPLKNFAESISLEEANRLVIDLKECIWMDSTFMGTLAVVGLKAKNAGVFVEIYNTSEKNFNLMNELGITPLFKYCDEKGVCSEKWEDLSQKTMDNSNIAETVLTAHETLMEVDNSNISKFGRVVELIRKDADLEKGR